MVNEQHLAALKIGPEWVDPLNSTFERFRILTPRQQAAFIAQCAHECGNFKVLEENLNYRADTLMKLWPRRFPTRDVADQYARNPKKIANLVYANRMGNRDEASGDGYRFRGRGCIQLTGSANYFHAGQSLGVDLIMDPDQVATPTYAALTAGWFWQTHECNLIANAGDIKALTKKINGGYIGLEDRMQRYAAALSTIST